jgi:uncharacterized Zn finger protein
MSILPSGVRGHCPKCGPNCNAEVLKEHHVDYKDDYPGGYRLQSNWGEVDYKMLQCLGCGSVYFQISEYHSEEGGELSV